MSDGDKHPTEAAGPASEDKEDYAGGYIQAYHGRIPLWLIVVYFGLALWGLYYLYRYWGSFGPGLGY
ncbi:MAG: hypothetical protein ACFCUQ_15790 [Kiloniellales bacterium]